MKKLLVTGGAGFIGSHLMEVLAQKTAEYDVVVIDNLSSGSRKHVPEKFKFICKDIRDHDLADVFAAEKFDAVIHLAAQTMVPYSLEHPQDDCDINLLGLLNILECCRQYNVRNIVFSSSAAVYGDNKNIPLLETEQLVPTSFYGITKMTSEHYLRVYHALYGINAAVLRFANVYGERQGEGGEGGVISIFCKLLAKGEAVTVFGDGSQTRDFVYAGDVAQALADAVETEGFNIINISTKKETSLKQLLAAFEQAVGRKIQVNYAPPRDGDILRSVLDNTNCARLLHFVPQMDLYDGVQKTYNDYLSKRGSADETD